MRTALDYRVALARPTIPAASRRLLGETLDANEIGQGPMIGRLEDRLAEMVGVRHAIAVASGTTAAQVLLMALDARSVGLPALTFCAQDNAAASAGVERYFVEVDERALMLFDGRLAMPAHLLGFPARWVLTAPQAIEDACESFGTRVGGRMTGSLGLAGYTSFYASHTVVGGEGGAIFTDEDALAAECRVIRNHGMTGVWHRARLGANAKISSLAAAVVLGQLEDWHFEDLCERRRQAAALYVERLGPRAHWPELPDEYVVPHALGVRATDPARTLAALQAAGVEARPFFHVLAPLPAAESWHESHVIVPCHQSMDELDVHYVCGVLEEAP